MMKSYSLIFILLLLCCVYSRAQVVVKGKVTDGQNRQGLGYASVSVHALKDSSLVNGQVTDSAGVFALAGIPGGSYLLRVQAMGYQPLQQAIVVSTASGSQVDLGSLSLTPAASLLTTVTVNGSRPAFRRESDRLILPISGNPLFAASANTFDILRKLPGLEVSSDGTIQINGRVAPAIFIDGKPVPMSPEEMQAYLSSLTPDMIASISVINNPSARYDGEYKGIIDIQLKRDQTLGWQGNINLNSQQNTYNLTESNLQLTYKSPRIVYTGRFGYTTGTRDYRYHALQHQANTNIMATNTPTATGHRNFNLQLGADYRLKPGQQLEILVRYNQQNRDIRALNTLYTTTADAKQVVSHTATTTLSNAGQDNKGINLNYSNTSGKYQLEVLGSFLQINNRQDEDIQQRHVGAGSLLAHWKTDLKNDIQINTIQADVSRQAGKGKLSAGGRFAFTSTKNDLRYDTLDNLKGFVPDSGRTNQFHYQEYISAAYLSYEHTQNQWQYAVSLRAEHTYSIANAITTQEITRRDYLKLLPAVNVTYSPTPSRQIQLSYSRKMTRPNFSQLNPFRFYFSLLNYWVGNPYLLPSATDMLSISYTQPSFNITLSAGRETDPMTRYPEYDSATNILQYLGRNLPYNDLGNIEVSFPLKITSWWRMNHNIRGTYKKELTPYHDRTYAIPITDLTVSGSQTFMLPYTINLDLSYFYRSQSGNGLYRVMPMSSIDIGLQRTWLKGQLNTRINYYDIFDNNKVKSIFREKSIINNELNHWFGNQRMSLTVSYNFGKSTLKARQQRKNEEEGRAGM